MEKKKKTTPAPVRKKKSTLKPADERAHSFAAVESLIMIRLAPVVAQIEMLNATLTRMAALYELHLQKIDGLTTDTRNVPLADLADTKVAYNDSELGEMIERLETEAGRPLNSDELERVMKAWNEETGAS